MKIWHRYLFFSCAQMFIFALFLLFFLYTMIDLSIYGVRFFTKHAGLLEVAKYYFQNFATHLDFFSPLAFLIAIVHILLKLNRHHELTALQMAGISKQKLLLPFWVLASLISLVNFANAEWISPLATSQTDSFRKAHTKKKTNQKKEIQILSLENGSELVFQEMLEKELYDVFWIAGEKEVWHIKYLNLEEKPAMGRFAERFAYQEHRWEKVGHFTKQQFPEIVLSGNLETKPLEARPISHLFCKAISSQRDAKKAEAHLFYKLILLLFPYLTLQSLSSTLFRFQKKEVGFWIFSIGLFGLIGCKTVLDGMLILAENEVIRGSFAMGSCLLLPLGIYAIMRNAERMIGGES